VVLNRARLVDRGVRREPGARVQTAFVVRENVHVARTEAADNRRNERAQEHGRRRLAGGAGGICAACRLSRGFQRLAGQLHNGYPRPNSR
jgi:hypothetical protein